MDDEDDFTPKLGKSRAGDGKKVVRYGARIVAAARLAGRTTGVRSRRFDGSRIGRGASIGRLLSSRDRFAGLRARRAIVKTRLVRLGAKGLAGARAHLRYIQRDGVTREGAPGQLYGPATDQADGKAFLERSAEDRHQFRFIVSAEDGAQYEDLKPLTRRLMTQMEEDLRTELDWVAVDHFNTGHPHTHIILRGIDDRGQDLVIARDYPLLGACYGIGVIGTHQGGTVDRTYSEPIGRVQVTLTDAGCADPLLVDLPGTFEAFVGHKEAIRDLPAHAVHLASSPACPVQAFRIGRNVYATQFHPELDIHGLVTRIDVYRHAGYFEPDQAESVKAMARAGHVFEPPRILARFVQRYATG